MQLSNFIAQCDLEINDKVKLVFSGSVTQDAYVIDDIRTIHYLKKRTTDFEFKVRELYGDRVYGWLRRDNIQYPMKE